MASTELIISEKEWQDLIAFKVYAKTLFDVEITRKDLDLCDSRKDPHADCNSNDPGGVISKGLHFYPNDPGGVHLKGIDLTEQNCYGDDVLSPPPVIALLETKTSPENLEKCRKFICAFNPSHPDFRKITLHINSQKSLEMVRDSVTRIQQSTAALIGIHQNQMDISIQGHHCCVEAASEMLRHGLKFDSIETDGQAHPLCVGIVAKSHEAAKPDTCNEKSSLWLESQMSLKANTTPRPLSSNRIQTAQNDKSEGIENVVNLSSFSNTLMNETNEVVSNANGDLINSPQHHLREPCENSCDSLSEEDDDVLEDERLKKHIDQASKCGFSDRQIGNVLQRLGVNCSMDDMMRELVKEPQVVENDDIGSDSKESESVVGGDIASREHGPDEDEEDFNVDDSSNLRHIVIDGSNVAMSHGQKVFSCMGIKIVVDWFKKRGHQNITVFVPQWRKEASRPDAPISNQEILTELEEERIVVFTPSRRVAGTRIVCYDDRYVLQLAAQTDGIVVSNDVYRDLVRERDDFREVVEKRLLMYSFVKDTFMPPEDPLGRQGPSLDNLLRIRQAEPKHRPQNCPYGKKCTYGNKCKYYHPERRYGPQKMVAEKLKESAELKLKSGSGAKSVDSALEKGKRPKQKLSRTLSMLPQEFGGRAYSDETTTEMHRKPPLLQHSKSLVYPSSYLTELRLKMEIAESEETSATLSDCRFEVSNPEQISGKDVDVINDMTQHFSASCNASPCASPVAANDLVKSKITAVRSFPLSPVRNLSPFSGPIDPPVTTSNPESQVRYLSGHLFVAKKLSDEESNRRNFFSQHTSRVPGSQGQERKGPCYEECLSSAAIVSSPTGGSTNTITKPLTSSQSQQHAAEDSRDAFGCPEIFFPPEIPTTSASRDQKAYNKEDKPAPLSHSHPLTKPLREDGAYPSHSLNSPVPNNYDSSSALFTQKDVLRQPPPQLQFTRSISSTAPSPSSSDYHHLRMPLDRKVSLGNISSVQPKVQSGMGSFSSNPPYFQQAAKIPFPPPFQRMQGSFDSGASSGFYSEQSYGMFSPTEDSGSPFQNGPKVSSPALFSPTQNPAQLMMQQQQHQRMMYHSSPPPPPTTPYVYQMGADGTTTPTPAYSGCPPFSPWQWQQQSPMTTRMPFDPPYSSPCPIQTSTLPATMPPTHSPLYSSADLGMNYPTQAHYQTINPMAGFASPDGSYYPVQGQGTYVASPLSYETSAPPHSPFAQAPSSKVIDEEAPINVADPRYPIYYNLSSVFGERVVRTFMNRNPDVSGRNVKELYSLISVYKQEMGM